MMAQCIHVCSTHTVLGFKNAVMTQSPQASLVECSESGPCWAFSFCSSRLTPHPSPTCSVPREARLQRPLHSSLFTGFWFVFADGRMEGEKRARLRYSSDSLPARLLSHPSAPVRRPTPQPPLPRLWQPFSPLVLQACRREMALLCCQLWSPGLSLVGFSKCSPRHCKEPLIISPWWHQSGSWWDSAWVLNGILKHPEKIHFGPKRHGLLFQQSITGTAVVKRQYPFTRTV